MIKLYALSIVPQMSACKPSTHKWLMDKLYYSAYNEDYKIPVLNKLTRMFDCLGISCKDIGAYRTSLLGQCADPPSDLHLAGYKPLSPHYQHAKIDLDILQIKILCTMKSWTSARLVYAQGRNSVISADKRRYRTLNEMAISPSRSIIIPFFNIFSSYNSNPDYASDIIDGAFY